MPRMLWMVLVVGIAAGQTQIDMNTQAKHVPIKSGASLPSTCAVGQVYFLTVAATGSNLYGCTAVNTWTPQGGQGGGGTTLQGTLANMPPSCTTGQIYFATDAAAGANLFGCSATNTWTSEGGNETVDSNGVAVGSRPTTNFQTGSGLISLITDTGTQINIQSALDTAVVATLPSEQTGSSLLCSPGSGSSSAYNCLMTPMATTYTVGMVLHWIPDVSGAGGATTLNVDTLGARGVKQADGVSDPASADIVAGSMRELWYDGVNFRFLNAGQTAGGGSGSIQSVFGRTGPVVALSGDYAASQVTNAVATNASNTYTAGTQDFSGAAHTRPAIVVSATGNLPTTCAVGEMAVVSGEVAGQQLYECSAANVWTQQSAASGGGSGAGLAAVFDTYANRPTCNTAAAGTFFWASDISNKKWICDGATWQPVAFDMRVVEPTTLTWSSIVGAGTDTPAIINVAGAVQLSGVRTSTNGGYNFLGMLTPLSMSPPYTIEIAFTFEGTLNYSSVCQWGVSSGNTASSVILGPFYYANNYRGVCGSLFNNLCAGPRGTPGYTINAEPVIRGEMVDDGTNRKWYFNSGSGYQLLFAESDTADISSPPYWGIGCATSTVGDQFQLTLYHASVHH